MADELLPDRIQSQSNIISASTSPMNIYAWYNSADTTMYMYSDADVIKGNPNMRAFLNGYYNRLRYVSDISGLADIDVSGVTDISAFFQYNTTLTNLEPIADWNVSNVTEISGMFQYSKFKGDISQWDLSNVTDKEYMFDDDDDEMFDENDE
jgi:surface protein